MSKQQSRPGVRDGKTLLPADAVTTAPIAALGLVGGYLTARETGIRPLGGVVLAAAGGYAGRTWLAKGGPGVAGALSALYLGGFGASHPLAKRIGAWPAVLSVAGASALGSWALVDRKAGRR
ncbi:hypothetical protein KZX06_05330 [Micrococcus sp. EYE_162]|uniref:hypothetical protein n=1 Tax=unclassified Micrococcus TaxID=2620948 RepID=UPI002002F7DC|nr:MULTISPECIES: hypothetical protein [unclassified Micrococcus]MCK6095385.1 hypothetical protein [Micrococcus sp. EYE_212]MCK6171460.1 hypothetical protein [Micrococcus sp. EYE_162]